MDSYETLCAYVRRVWLQKGMSHRVIQLTRTEIIGPKANVAKHADSFVPQCIFGNDGSVRLGNNCGLRPQPFSNLTAHHSPK